jgi:hypothetical protein
VEGERASKDDSISSDGDNNLNARSDGNDSDASVFYIHIQVVTQGGRGGVCGGHGGRGGDVVDAVVSLANGSSLDPDWPVVFPTSYINLRHTVPAETRTGRHFV